MGAWLVAVLGGAVLGCAVRVAPPPPPPPALAAPVPSTRARALYLDAWANPDGAEPLLKTALLHDPDALELWIALAETATDPTDAAAYARQAVARHPDRADAWATLARLTDDADAYARATALGAEDPVWAAWCALLVARGDPGAAAAVAAWAARPLTGRLQQQRGELRWAVGDAAGAAADLNAALPWFYGEDAAMQTWQRAAVAAAQVEAARRALAALPVWPDPRWQAAFTADPVSTPLPP